MIASPSLPAAARESASRWRGGFAESGAKVAIVARGAEDLAAARAALAKDRLEVRDYVCDVSKAADISSAYEKITKDFGKIDVLVNNAGTSRAMAFETVTDEMWQQDLDLKLFAAIRFSRLVWPGMKERKMGPHHQRAQHSRQGTAAGIDADLGVARGRHGPDQSDGGRGRSAQYPGQCDAGRPDRQRSMGAAPREKLRRTPISTSSPPIWRRAFHSAGWDQRKNSPTWPASWLPTRAPTSRAPRSMSMAAARPWCSASRS